MAKLLITESLLLMLIVCILTFLFYAETPPYLQQLWGSKKERFTDSVKSCGHITSREIYPQEKEEMPVPTPSEEPEETEGFSNYARNSSYSPIGGILSSNLGAPFGSIEEDTTPKVPAQEIINTLEAPPAVPQTEVRVPTEGPPEPPTVNTPEEEPLWMSSKLAPEPKDIEEAQKIEKTAQWGNNEPGAFSAFNSNILTGPALMPPKKETPSPDALLAQKIDERKNNRVKWQGSSTGVIVDDPDTPDIDELALANQEWAAKYNQSSLPKQSAEMDWQGALDKKIQNRRYQNQSPQWEGTKADPTVDTPGQYQPIVDDPTTEIDEQREATNKWRVSQGFAPLPKKTTPAEVMAAQADLTNIINQSSTPSPSYYSVTPTPTPLVSDAFMSYEGFTAVEPVTPTPITMTPTPIPISWVDDLYKQSVTPCPYSIR
mgnify:CR=1 FL=1|tara:strand:+ start:2147 stop:3439 length:1293 start_codon:yes stop_codon:yes gene_type:complete